MGTVNYGFTYIDEEGVIDVPGDTKLFLNEIDYAMKETSTETTDYGYLTNFRYGYKPPSDFNAVEFLGIALNDKEVFSAHNWTYSATESTIPLFTEPYTVTNIIGEYTSCSAFVCDCLFKSGYADLAGRVHIIGAGESNLSLDEYLLSKGWTKVTKIEELTPGCIVGTSWRPYANVPGHCFIYVGSSVKYDCGSTSLVRSGGADTLNWTLYDVGNSETQINRITRSGFLSFKAGWPIDESYDYHDKENDTLEYAGYSVYDYPYIMVQASCEKGRVTRFSDNDGRNWKQLYDGMLPVIKFHAGVNGGESQSITSANSEIAPRTVRWYSGEETDFAKVKSSSFVGIKESGMYSVDISLTFGVDSIEANSRIGMILVAASNGQSADQGRIIGKFVTETASKTELSVSVTEPLDAGDTLYIRMFTENFGSATASLWTNISYTSCGMVRVR